MNNTWYHKGYNQPDQLKNDRIRNRQDPEYSTADIDIDQTGTVRNGRFRASEPHLTYK